MHRCELLPGRRRLALLLISCACGLAACGAEDEAGDDPRAKEAQIARERTEAAKAAVANERIKQLQKQVDQLARDRATRPQAPPAPPVVAAPGPPPTAAVRARSLFAGTWQG